MFDLFIIGGGINGCGIARDAAGRGYSVALAEMNDLASGTSSAATKLIHGGLRYLEHYKFRLVRESLMERETLWAMAPHIIRPMRFVLPYEKGGVRPAWMVRLGLFLYDHIGGRKLLPPTKTLDLRSDPSGKPLKARFRKAFEYSDGWVDDARLVVLNARDANDRGATIMPRTKVVSARRDRGHWIIETVNALSGKCETHHAKMLVNASGPWVDNVIREAFGNMGAKNVRLVQGSHIVVRKKFDDSRAYFFQNCDGRIFFAIPYEQDFTLIGTTDQDFNGDPKEVRISARETDYLCRAASDYFKTPVEASDIVWTYSGIRPLYDDGASNAQEATRDYVLRVETIADGAPLLNVFGGKLTTYRRLGEHTLEKIGQAIGVKGKAWTRESSLPGGEFRADNFDNVLSGIQASFPFVEPSHMHRLFRQYGLRVQQMLEGANSQHDLGICFGADLYEKEVLWLMKMEWANCSDDVIWRRTKLGLRLAAASAQKLEEYMSELTKAQNNAL